MTFQFKKPEDSPGFLLWQLTNHWQRLQRVALAKLGITHVQFVVLAALLWHVDHDQEVTQQDISEFACIDKMSMSDLVSTLQKKKMIKKVKSKNDGRAFALSLTERGKKIVLSAIPIIESIDKDFFNKKTPRLAQFIKLIKN